MSNETKTLHADVCPNCGAKQDGTIWEHADKLQKELNAYKAMVERLTRLAPAPLLPVSGLCLICHEKQTTCSSGLCEECFNDGIILG
jgi:hypothetical protein